MLQSAAGKPRRPSDPAATPQPDTQALAAIWGEDFESLTPNMTLKDRRAVVAPPDEAASAGLQVQAPGYDVIGVLGEGGVGVVYEAVQRSIDRRIAFKMIKPHVGQSGSEKHKFVTEAMVTGQLDHPNIVPIHDLGTTADGQPFYVMKLVRGTPWDSVLNQLTQGENLRVLFDVCDAVSFAHSKGVIHRDLKPENVMLGEFGEVQVMDWGLGARVGDDGNISRTHSAGGTPAYMAPEMVTGDGPPVGIHSDVYLLGAILYEIISGRPPHGGRRVLDCLQNALDNVIEPVGQTGVLVDIALRALQTDPVDRYASVQEFKLALLEYETHAESIKLTQNAEAEQRRAAEERDYERFARAVFGFREALERWPENLEAQQGLALTRLAYARCALEKGDLDLAGTVLDEERPDHRTLAVEIAVARERRTQARRWARIFRNVTIALTIALVLILTTATIWIAAERREALRAKEVAVAAQRAEEAQRVRAERESSRARAEEARAVQALADLEAAVREMMAARSDEERARAQARASEFVAARTRDELARTGMLLDNSWWVFDAAQARQRQLAAAADVGLPAELAVPLGAGLALELLLVPPGDFVMGSAPQELRRAADEHLHRVRHEQPFYLGRFELTEQQWFLLTGRAPRNAAGGTVALDLPAAGITVDEIRELLLPALQKHAPAGWVFRLPTEAEWEYACRAGTSTAYGLGDTPAELAESGWYLANSGGRVQAVGSRLPNAFGLYDMHGNVSEICLDEYLPGFYLESPLDAPLATGSGERPVVRGGSVFNVAEHCRSAYRSYVYRCNEYEFLGLRIALVPLCLEFAHTAPPAARPQPDPAPPR
jgi:formylglycine-generating enzyme required for sulfatase activity